MSLLTRMPHRADIYQPTSGSDAGGGVTITFALAQSSVPCRENVTGCSEREQFGQVQMVATGSLTFLTSTLTTTIQRGTKITTNGRSYHITGITVSQGEGTIPSITRVTAEDQL